MAGTFPYVASAGPLVKAITQLRKSFPKEVTAETLKKLGIAPNNESYVINTIRFIGLIDEESKRVDSSAKILANHHDEAFAKEFGELVSKAYAALFELHLESAWTLDKGTLIQFFRQTDHSSEVVGTRQAGTFAALSALSGHADVPVPKIGSATVKSITPKTKAAKVSKTSAIASASTGANLLVGNIDGRAKESGNVGLTVRIEVNLPASGDQETYDRIFQSIRKNLIDGQ